MSNYSRGRRFEYSVRDVFRRQGYVVIRAASSKPIDLVCLKDGRSILVECKTESSLVNRARLTQLRQLSKKAGTSMIVARKRKAGVELMDVATGRLLHPQELKHSLA